MSTRSSQPSRRCLGGLLMTSLATLAACENILAPPDSLLSDEPSIDVSSAIARRLPKKTPHPTYYPTHTPGKHKPKKTPSPVSPSPTTRSPTASPSAKPTDGPTPSPSDGPTDGPTTSEPSESPTANPTKSPSKNPTLSPSYSPTFSPSVSIQPSAIPSSPPTATQQPTVVPTGVPSSSPSSHPSLVPSVRPTTSAMPSSAPIPYIRTTRVDVRYRTWSELSAESQGLARQLDYNEANWNELGVNEVEYLNWLRLPREQKDAARQLGYDLYSWDCWQNHFQAYRWIDLDLPYVQAGQWWKVLGWGIYSWNRLEDPPESDETLWFDLSVDERFAAAQLCYFRSSWDEDEILVDGYPIERPEFRYRHWMDLSEEKRGVADDGLKYSALTWNVLGLSPIEGREWERLTDYEAEAALSLGFTRHSWDCWQNHYRGYSWDDLVLYSLDIPYLALGWTELSWDGVETPPRSSKMTWKELMPEERSVAHELCYFRANWDGDDLTPNKSDFPFPKVKQRYIQWDDLPVKVRRIARGSLLYERSSWNKLGTADVEKRRWTELTEHQKSDALSLGFYQRTWDCFHNHYWGYEWSELDRDSRDAMQVLGWSEARWKAKDDPPSYRNKWERLSEDEQSVASVLCFFEHNWDGNDLAGVIMETETEDLSGSDSVEEADPSEPTQVATDQGQEAMPSARESADLATSASMIGVKPIMNTIAVLLAAFFQILMD